MKFKLADRPSWPMFMVFLVMFFISTIVGAAVLVGFQEQLYSIRDAQESGRERALVNRAVACTIVILDDGRNFDVTSECRAADVAAYYPQEICDMVFGDSLTNSACGSKVDV